MTEQLQQVLRTVGLAQPCLRNIAAELRSVCKALKAVCDPLTHM